MTWSEFWGSRRGRREFIVSTVVLIASLYALSSFLDFVESRNGTVLNDPLLALFRPIDVTWLVFLIIYGSLALAVALLIKEPNRLLFTLQLYAMMIIVRMAAMYVVPLNPPEKMIPLADPFIQYFGSLKLLTKDLYFSGHTATMFILFLTAGRRKVKILFLAGTVLVAVLVLLQHVHYTIDVLSAPFFTYGCYRALIYFKGNIPETRR